MLFYIKKKKKSTSCPSSFPPVQLRAQALRERGPALGLGVQLPHQAPQAQLGALQAQRLFVPTALLRQQDHVPLQDVQQLLQGGREGACQTPSTTRRPFRPRSSSLCLLSSRRATRRSDDGTQPAAARRCVTSPNLTLPPVFVRTAGESLFPNHLQLRLTVSYGQRAWI